MSWLRFFRRKRSQAELLEEINVYLVEEIAENVARGMSPEEARRRARIKLGNPQSIEESLWQQNTFMAVDNLCRDLKYAAKTLARSRGFTLTATLVVALGIGANTAIFSVVNNVLLHPLPFHDPGRLMMLDEKWLPRFSHFEATPRDFLSWQEQSRAFEQIGAFVNIPFNFTGGDRAERITGERVTANVPALLGVQPILGRSFTPEEDTAGNDHVVLLGYRLWQRSFGGNPQVIGTAVKLNGIDFTVIGVMPPSFRFPQDAEIWKPMGFTPQDFDGGHFIRGIGRLKPDVTRNQAQAEMDSIMPRLQHPQVWSVNVFPMLDYYVGEVRLRLYVLLGAAGFVLLIACVNVANLLLVRGSVRQKEFSLRTALGAGRVRIVQQLLTESLLLSLLGGIFGVLLATGAIIVAKKFSPVNTPRLNELTINYSVLLFALVLSALTGILFGLWPALRCSRTDIHDSLKAGGRVAGAGKATRMRGAFVVSEVALALVLLTGSGLLLKSFWRLLEVQPGFIPENVVTAEIDLPPLQYEKPYQQTQFTLRLIEQLRRLPDIRQAAVSAGLPFSDIDDAGIRFGGRPPGAPDSGTTANYYRVTPMYFRAMEIPLIRGRLFSDHDIANSQPVVLINQTMAKQFFAREDPLGKRLDIAGPTSMREIVGVVGDVKQTGLKAAVPPQVYEPFFQKPSNSFSVVVRGVGNPLSLAESVRRQVLVLDEEQPISNVRTMGDIVGASMSQDRLSTSVLGLFALLALILAAVGIYGVIAYSVAQRTNEIGIRMALGARRTGILKLILAESLQIVLIGLGIGLVASFGLMRLLSSLLYEVKANDPIIFVAVSVVLLVAAIAAAYVPARRASRIDPIVALRYD
jgi:putative ABC transport system permease protein